MLYVDVSEGGKEAFCVFGEWTREVLMELRRDNLPCPYPYKYSEKHKELAIGEFLCESISHLKL